MRKITNIVLSSFAAAATCLQSLPAQACIFDSRPYFTYTVHPDIPLNSYASGKLGIVLPTYARSYLLVAYRYLLNEPLSAEEQKAMVEFWNKRLTASWDVCGTDTSAWLKARTKVPGAPKLEEINVTRPISTESPWETYCNCQTSGFETAAKTLGDMIAKHGVGSTEVKDWLTAQDKVFANCGSNPYSDKKPTTVIPEPLPSNADPALQRDRDYQIAAANFYAQNLDTAQQQFEKIAADKNSPWRQVAAYLAVRTMLRRATLAKTTDNALLTQAAAKAKQLSADPEFASMRGDLQALENFAAARLNPVEYLQSLVKSVKPLENVADITATIDKIQGDSTPTKYDDAPASLKQPDVLDWITAFQAGDESAHKHAVSRWKETHATPWLVAALTSAKPTDTDVNELLKDAKEKDHSGAEHWTLQYNSNQLNMEKGKADIVLPGLNTVVNNPPSDLPTGALNSFKTQRLALAANLDEFVRFGVQIPISVCSNGLVSEVPDDIADIIKNGKSASVQVPVFTPQAGDILANQLPLTMLTQLSTNSKLTSELRNNVAWTSWVRAVLVGDDSAAHKLAEIVKPMNKAKTALFDGYLSATTPEARKFAAVFLMLQFSSATPNATWGSVPPDGYGDASGWWWYEHPAIRSISLGMGDSDDNNVKPVNPPFITAPLKAQSKAELAKLETVSAAPSYFARVVLPFAKAHPGDPRVPQALHFLVKATRYGSTDDATKAYSKEAFSILHSKYKDSPWTKKTPYYY